MHVALATVRPDSSYSSEPSDCILSKRVQHALIWFASTTLLCLNGLKSSLI